MNPRILLLLLVSLLFANYSHASLIVGWEQWGGSKAASQTDGVTATTANNTGNNNGFGLHSGGSTDGTWGTLAIPPADATTNENADGFRLTNGEDGSLDFVLTDTSGTARDLTSFHFDTATWRPNAANDWELEVVSGDITLGSVQSGNAPNIAGGTPDWYDYDIDLTGLSDNTLDAFGTVTFRLNFTGGVLNQSGHHQSLDNVAVSANSAQIPEPISFYLALSGTVSLLVIRNKFNT